MLRSIHFAQATAYMSKFQDSALKNKHSQFKHISVQSGSTESQFFTLLHALTLDNITFSFPCLLTAQKYKSHY